MLTLDLLFTEAQEKIFSSKTKFTIVPKGRRFGATKGSANAVMEWALDGISPMLWVDTINPNIDRYYERYFLPELKKSGIKYSFNYNKKILTINDSIVDMRSADAPESIEGFGYKKIILNEAGIILKDNYLFTNTILPMLIDFPDSQLYAIGTPKGKYKKNGEEHIFYQLSKREGSDYTHLNFSSYDNPLLNADDIKKLEDEVALLDPAMIDQEIFGRFVESKSANAFMTQYKSEKHESLSAIFQQGKPILMSVDFNLNPFCISFAHLWSDDKGEHCHFFDELELINGSIPQMIDEIKLRYGRILHTCKLTGDSMGKRKSIEERDNSSYYLQLQRGLGLRDSQLILPNNPTHENSRADCNYILYHFPDLLINPVKCKGLCRDMKIVQCDSYGSIIKSNRGKMAERADFLDTFRYFVNGFLWDWIRKRK